MRCAERPFNKTQPIDVRSYFDTEACHVHGHPSSGGIIIKRFANLVDLQHLSLPRLKASKRSPNVAEEDAFCDLMRRLGATWWRDESMYWRALSAKNGIYNGEPYEEENDEDVQNANEARAKKIVMFGWPADGVGVWVLRSKNNFEGRVPSDYGRLDFALNMEERIEVMKKFGAEFVEDLSQVREFQEPWTPEANLRYNVDDYNLHRTPSSGSS